MYLLWMVCCLNSPHHPAWGQGKRLSSTRVRLEKAEPLSSWGPERRYGEEFLPNRAEPGSEQSSDSTVTCH